MALWQNYIFFPYKNTEFILCLLIHLSCYFSIGQLDFNRINPSHKIFRVILLSLTGLIKQIQCLNQYILIHKQVNGWIASDSKDNKAPFPKQQHHCQQQVYQTFSFCEGKHLGFARNDSVAYVTSVTNVCTLQYICNYSFIMYVT